MDLESWIDEAYNIGMPQYRKEVQQLFTFLCDKNISNFLEIGTFRGGTFSLLAKISDGIKISVDVVNEQTDGTNYSYEAEETRALVESLGGVFINNNSHLIETLSKVKNILNNQKLDLLYIDGDHSYEGAKLDFKMYYPLVRDDGYIIFHDIKANILECKVCDLWNELKMEYKVALELISPEIIDCGIGVIQK